MKKNAKNEISSHSEMQFQKEPKIKSYPRESVPESGTGSRTLMTNSRLESAANREKQFQQPEILQSQQFQIELATQNDIENLQALLIQSAQSTYQDRAISSMKPSSQAQFYNQ